MDNVRLEVKIRSVPKDPRNLILLDYQPNYYSGHDNRYGNVGR